MPTYLSPGVYVEEVAAGARPIEGVGTSVAAFVGMAQSGPVNQAVLVTNWSQFVQSFGEPMAGSYLGHAVYGYFLNGGGTCYVVRIGGEQPPSPARAEIRPRRTRRSLASGSGSVSGPDREPSPCRGQRRKRACRRQESGHVQAHRPLAGAARRGVRQRLHEARQGLGRHGRQDGVQAHRHRGDRSREPGPCARTRPAVTDWV